MAFITVEYQVEMRGERSEEGIVLKVKDIGQVFGLKRLAHDIQHQHTQHQESEHYVWFTIPKNEREKNATSRELFFTYKGMLLTVHISQSPVAKQFRDWVSKTVFVHHLGTQKQKKQLAKSLLDKKTIDCLTKCCVNKIACIYLLETGKPPHEVDGVAKQVYKFGFSKNVKDRMDKHVTRYGRDSVIDTLVLLPLEYVSQAEAKLKASLGDRYKYKDAIDPSTELLLLSQVDRTTVRDVMRVVGETFFGETVVHMHTLEMHKKDAELELSKKDQELITAKKDLDTELAKKDAELAKKDTELAKKETELVKSDAKVVILEMKNEAQARRIKELEDQLLRCEKGHVP